MDKQQLRKGIVATAIVSVVTLGGLSLATEEKVLTTEEYCQLHFSDAKEIMEFRQSGIENKDVAYQTAIGTGFAGNEKKRAVVEHLIDESFLSPVYYDYQSQQKAISEFDGYSLCVDFVDNNKKELKG